MRGHTVKRPPESVTTINVKIPRAILKQHQRVTLAVFVMFVNGVPFLVSVSQGINLVSAEHAPSRTARQLAAGIIRIMDLYSCGGFQVGTMLIDNEFEKLSVLIPILVMNTAAAKEHVPEEERCTRLIKEHGRGILNTLPFKKMPQIMLIKLIYHVVLWLNAFLTKSGVSKMLLPCKIVYRHKLDFTKHCKARFGTYCKAHNEPTPKYMMVTRSAPGTVLGPTGNLQGTYKFFKTITGKKIKQQKLTAYPMPESIIKKMEQFCKSNARLNTLNFANRNGILFKLKDDINEYSEGLVKEDVVFYPSLVAEIPRVVLEQDLPIPMIEGKIDPQGCAKDAAARNANLEPFNVTGVDAPTIIRTNNNKINVINDDNNSILLIATTLANNNHDPLILPDTSDSDTLDDKDQCKDEEYNKDNLSNNDLDGQEADKPEEGLTDDQDEGVRRSKRNNKGMTV